MSNPLETMRANHLNELSRVVSAAKHLAPYMFVLGGLIVSLVGVPVFSNDLQHELRLRDEKIEAASRERDAQRESTENVILELRDVQVTQGRIEERVIGVAKGIDDIKNDLRPN